MPVFIRRCASARFAGLVGVAGLGLAAPATAQSGPGPAPAASTITLLHLNQPPCATPSARTVIKAKLAYTIAPGEQSDYGFAVSIKFQGATPGRTFSNGQLGQVAVTQRADTLTITYPLAQVLGSPQLGRPITYYFYLHRNTAPGRSRVIAQTPPLTLQECQ